MARLLPLRVGLYVFAGVLALLLAVGIAATVKGRLIPSIAPLVRSVRSTYASLLLGSARPVAVSIAGFVFHLGLAITAILHLVLLGHTGAKLYMLGPESIAAIIDGLRAAAAAVAVSGIVLLLLHGEQLLRGFRISLCSIIGTALLTLISLAVVSGYTSLNTHIALGLLGLAFAAYMAISSHIARGSRLLAMRLLRV